MREGRKEQTRAFQAVDLQSERARMKVEMYLVVRDGSTQGIQETEVTTITCTSLGMLFGTLHLYFLNSGNYSTYFIGIN